MSAPKPPGYLPSFCLHFLLPNVLLGVLALSVLCTAYGALGVTLVFGFKTGFWTTALLSGSLLGVAGFCALYSAMLASEDSQESQDRLENLAELLSAAADYEAVEEAPTLTGFLDRAALLTDADQVKGEAPVVLMTLHAAKGLEFDRGFLVGLEEGLVPH